MDMAGMLAMARGFLEEISPLQLGLSVAGVVIVLAVLLHGVWVSRRNQPRQAEPEPPRLEPQADGPELERADPGDGTASLPLPAVERKPVLDPLIDVIAPITLDAPVSGEAVLAHLPATRRVGSKPFAIEGLNEHTQQWEPPQAGQRYAGLQAGVQLANRAGALNEIEYSEFVVKTQAFADILNGSLEFPEMRDEVARARELDQFAGAHDAQLNVTLRARNAAWSPGYVQQQAARQGFMPGALPGRLVLPAAQPGLPPVLVLSFDAHTALAEDPAQSAITVLTLLLDVPQVERSELAFTRMREAAGKLAEAMDGLLTDDNGQPLTAAAMDQIAVELDRIYDTLESRDLAAGSLAARRLFS